MKRLLHYWPEALVFGAVATALMVALAPDLTWFSMAVDGTAYVMSAKWLYPAHHTSAPLYLLVGHLFTMIPLGTDYWRLGLLSVVSALVAMVFVYLIVMKLLPDNKNSRWYALVGSGLFGSTMMLISQATIVEPFTMVTALSLAAFYFSLKKKWAMTALMIGLGLAVHHLILITWIVLLIFRKDMRNWKIVGISLACLSLYAYIPLSKMFSDQPNMWGNTSIMGFLTDNVFTFAGLVGGLAIWELPKRIFEMLGFWAVCLTIGLIPLVWYAIKTKMWHQPLFWLFMLPWVYGPLTNLDPHVSRYALPGLAFATVIVALGLSKMNKRWMTAGVGVGAIAMLGFNANFWDLGRTLDPNLTAAKFYNEEYPKVADNQIMMNFLPGGEWEMAFYYNKKEGKHIVPVCIGMLANPTYQDQLKAQGIKFETNNLTNSTDNEMEMALSIARLNPNVLIAKPTTIEDYGAVLVPALENQDQMTMWEGYKAIPKWKFMPDNPYDILTGKLELTKWQFTLQSNWNVKFFFAAFMIGVLINWLLSGMPRKRKAEVTDEATTEHS